MSTPPDVLIARALHFLELAQLQLKNGASADASMSIATAVKCLEGVTFS